MLFRRGKPARADETARVHPMLTLKMNGPETISSPSTHVHGVQKDNFTFASDAE
jgi:hypothetical protein